MKKNLQLFTLSICSIIFFTSCDSDDEPTPPHIVGTWKLQSYAIINVPAAFSDNEGLTFELSEVSLGIESYELDLMKNGNFDRDVSFSGVLPLHEDGTWELSDDEEELSLIIRDGDEEVFDVEKNIDDDLWISFPINFNLINNEARDTLTTEILNGLTDEESAALFVPVPVDFVFVMEKEVM